MASPPKNQGEDVTELPPNPMVINLLRRVRDTEVFLRMAAVELRRIAEQTPDIAAELRHVAQKLGAEAEELAGRNAQ